MKRWTTLPVSIRHRDPREVGPGKMDGLFRTAKHEVTTKNVVDDVDKQLHIILRFNKITKLIKELNGTLRILKNSKSFLIPSFIKSGGIRTSTVLRTILDGGSKHIFSVRLHLACKKGNRINNNKVRVCVI